MASDIDERSDVQAFREVISQWQHSWRSQSDYLERASGIDSNMKWDLARRLGKHHDAVVTKLTEKLEAKDAEIAELKRQLKERTSFVSRLYSKAKARDVNLMELQDLCELEIQAIESKASDKGGGV